MPHRSNSVPPQVSARQRQIACLLCRGFGHKHIARAVGITAKMVAVHRGNIVRKLGVRGLGALTVLAIRWGWLTEADMFPTPTVASLMPPDPTAMPDPCTHGTSSITAPPRARIS